jgi:hypothetical protein
MKTNVSINDLPKFSPWPHRILGLSQFQRKPRSHDENKREYDEEKWRSALEAYRRHSNLNFRDYLELEFTEADSHVCVKDGELQRISARESFQIQVDLIYEALSDHLPASGLVELGAGTGRIIFALLDKLRNASIRAIAAEFSANGRKLISEIAKASGYQLETLPCDLCSEDIVTGDVPKNAVIFTSMAIVCVPQLPQTFVERLLSLNPKVVVHYEPVYAHCNTEGLLGSMQKRYIEINDYNTNLREQLKVAEGSGKIEILAESGPTFGTNPFLPGSILIWKPSNT